MAGTVLPYGDYKGFGIALMVDLMAGAMTGARFSHQADSFVGEEGGPPDAGQFFIAMDTLAFGGEHFTDRVEELFSVAVGEPGVQLPGDKRLAALEASRTRPIAISRELYDNLIERAGDGVPI